MTQFTREQYGAKAPGSPFEAMPNLPVSTVFIHHSATASTDDGAKDARNIDQGERSRGYIAMAYHALVHKSGDRYEGRIEGGQVKLGAATINNNLTSLAICFDGNFENEVPSTEAMEQAAQLIADWVRKGWLKSEFVTKPHKAVFNTACPGKNLTPHVDAIGQRARDILFGGSQPAPQPTPTPAPAPTPAPTPTVPAFPGTVRRGSKGAVVGLYQARLKARGWNINVDNDFGPATENIVRQFQAEKGLVVDGIAGPATWNKLWTSPVT